MLFKYDFGAHINILYEIWSGFQQEPNGNGPDWYIQVFNHFQVKCQLTHPVGSSLVGGCWNVILHY